MVGALMPLALHEERPTQTVICPFTGMGTVSRLKLIWAIFVNSRITRKIFAGSKFLLQHLEGPHETALKLNWTCWWRVAWRVWQGSWRLSRLNASGWKPTVWFCKYVVAGPHGSGSEVV